MDIRIILWTGSVFIGACSIKQQRQSESSQGVSAELAHVRFDSVNRRDTLAELFGRQLLIGRELLDITPLGPFTYRPDSGFTGQASSIRIYREQTRLSDSLQRRQGSEEKQVAGQKLIAHRAETTRISETRASGYSAFRWWWLALITLVPVLWQAFRWYRSR